MLEIIQSSPSTLKLQDTLRQIDDERKGTLLVRHFATQDDLGNAFRVLHAMKAIGTAPDKETYRYLMYGCCKYHDLDLGLYVMENMLYDNTPDFKSFKRLFDACASAVDLRLWVAYDVMMWFYPLQGFGSNALKTTAYITEVMKTLGMRDSARAGRGFVTLPNYRGEPIDVFDGMFEDYDPNYPQLERRQQNMQISDGGEHGEPDVYSRLRLVAEEFEDRNNLAKIVERNQKRRLKGDEDYEESVHLDLLESSEWSVEAVTTILKDERGLEKDHLKKLSQSLKEKAIEEAKPAPSIKTALANAWNRKKEERRMNRKD
jgi:hypothetical protein